MKNPFQRIFRVDVPEIEPTTTYYRGVNRELAKEKSKPKSLRDLNRIEFLQKEKARVRKGIVL